MQASKTFFVRTLVLLALIPLGMSTRRYPGFYPDFFAEFGGDTLWATLVTLLFALAAPKASQLVIALAAWFFALFIELSQLYHAPWIDAIRSTTPGALVLGFDFLWSDLACYTVGIGLGCLILWATAERNAASVEN
ncbi:MAG: DUF2809 domain-containing protein [Planctomycetales bacterium]|nr:DUF2809 domain-containing protein [Planctomycetales bacterium]